MKGYIVSKSEYKITDVFAVAEYNIELDGDFNGKSSVVCSNTPNASEDDWFYLMDGRTTVLTGIIESITNNDGQNEHTINLKESQKLFDRKIILENESLLETGIEDFIADAIRTNFVNSDDEFMNLPYIHVEVLTHTPVLAKPQNENGIFNLCTYIGNAMTTYGVFTDIHLTQDGVYVTIEKKELPRLNIDCSVSDIVNYSETYEVNALTKLIVRWCIPESENSEGVKTPASYTVKQYFLKNDRTITDDIHDTDRASGSTDTVYIEAETEQKLYEEVVNQFKSNSYNHSVECSVKSGSKLFPVESLFVGAEVKLKTRSHGVHDSIITNVTRSNTSRFIGVKFGKLKITLIEKLRKGSR